MMGMIRQSKCKGNPRRAPGVWQEGLADTEIPGMICSMRIDVILVQGAQPPEAFADAVRQALADSPPTG